MFSFFFGLVTAIDFIIRTNVINSKVTQSVLTVTLSRQNR